MIKINIPSRAIWRSIHAEGRGGAGGGEAPCRHQRRFILQGGRQQHRTKIPRFLVRICGSGEGSSRKPGGKIMMAITGASGVGKSSLVNAFRRLTSHRLDDRGLSQVPICKQHPFALVLAMCSCRGSGTAMQTQQRPESRRRRDSTSNSCVLQGRTKCHVPTGALFRRSTEPRMEPTMYSFSASEGIFNQRFYRQLRGQDSHECVNVCVCVCACVSFLLFSLIVSLFFQLTADDEELSAGVRTSSSLSK